MTVEKIVLKMPVFVKETTVEVVKLMEESVQVGFKLLLALKKYKETEYGIQNLRMCIEFKQKSYILNLKGQLKETVSLRKMRVTRKTLTGKAQYK